MNMIRIVTIGFIMLTLVCQVTNTLAQKIEPIGSGLTLRGEVHDILFPFANDDYYVVGDFAQVDSIPVNKVAFRRGDTWQAIEDTSYIDGTIYCATYHMGELYIAGRFTIHASEPIHHLAKLEDGVWKPLGIREMQGAILDLIWFEDQLYVTGPIHYINDVVNDGVMKLENGRWTNAGLVSQLKSREFQIIGDTLFTWGNAYENNAGLSHTVSFMTAGVWKTLPEVTDHQFSLSTSFSKYKGKIFSTINRNLYSFNEDLNTWEIAVDELLPPDPSDLFVYQDSLYVICRDFYIAKLHGQEWLHVHHDITDENAGGDINQVAIKNNKIFLTGDFINWSQHTLSLLYFENWVSSSQGRFASNTSYKDQYTYALANSIVHYNDRYLIAGYFQFADYVYSPNIVYWDGEKFEAFEAPLLRSVKQLEVFENELYAVAYHTWRQEGIEGFKLIKFNGTEWVGVETPLEFDRIIILHNKLFIMNDRPYHSLNGGPFYLHDGEWHELPTYPVGRPDLGYLYDNIEAFYDGYLMTVQVWPGGHQLIQLDANLSEWSVIDSSAVWYERVYVLAGRIFLLNYFLPNYIFEYRDGQFDTISQNVTNDNPHFYQLFDETIFFSAQNGPMHIAHEESEMEPYSELMIYDVEKIDEQTRLIAVQNAYIDDPFQRKTLNCLAILKDGLPHVEIMQDRSEICAGNFTQFWPKSNEIGLKYVWQFEGGIPARSTSVFPMVNYDSSGIYSVTLFAYNLLGDTTISTSSIQVNTCSSSRDLTANNYDNNWMMGHHYYPNTGLGGLNFSLKDSIQSPRYLSDVEMYRGLCVMSDRSGNLQFYTNGYQIMNRDNEVMTGSDCFQFSDPSLPEFYLSNQSLMSIPAINNDSMYYLFDIEPKRISGDNWLAGNKLTLTTINMRGDDGLGEVVSCKDIIIEDDLLNSTMQATRHANQKDWWIIVGKHNSNEYYKIRLTGNGIESIQTDNWTIQHLVTISGQSTFSPDGQYFAQVINEDQEVNIWRFDNETGSLYDHKTYTITSVDEYENPYGCSFSPNSRFLYISSLSQLRQLDLCQYDEIEMELIAEWDGRYEFFYPLFFGKQMLTPLENIVVVSYGNSHRSLGLINSPNKKGIDCDFRQHYIKLNEYTRNLGDVIPYYPHFRQYETFDGDCAVATETPSHQERAAIFPNPVQAGNVVHFSTKASGSIFDISGNFISQFQQTDMLDIGSLHAGSYLIRTNNGIEKLIIVE